MAQRGSTVRRSLPQVQSTLLYLDPGDGEQVERNHEITKTEKSVHFATDYDDSVSDTKLSTTDSLKTSHNVVTLQHSDHLYSSDTFISETHTDGFDPDYSPNTLTTLESDETRTVSDISHTSSLASSTVFSPSGSFEDDVSESSVSREWKDVTDIVKDIDELEESEFVAKRKSPWSEEEETTDISDSEDEDMAAIQREQFLMSTIRRLKLRDVLSPRSLAVDLSPVSLRESLQTPTKLVSDEEISYCAKIIECCRKKRDADKKVYKTDESIKAKPKQQMIEFYGLSSAIVDRLKMKNFQQNLAKKCSEIDGSIEKSLNFIEQQQDINADIMKQKFISESLGCVQRQNMDECIQAHLIKMHPVKQFADFVKGLPKCDENSQEILYKYKRKLEVEMEKG